MAGCKEKTNPLQKLPFQWQLSTLVTLTPGTTLQEHSLVLRKVWQTNTIQKLPFQLQLLTVVTLTPGTTLDEVWVVWKVFWLKFIMERVLVV